MFYREAEIKDIPQLIRVRFAVKENRLNNPALVTDNDYLLFITQRGKGWVCEIDGAIVGFAVVDLVDDNVWALFVDPIFEAKGIGKQLHKLMLDWYFAQGKQHIWLGTAPNTRAEQFYTKQGWANCGLRPNGEVRFELTIDAWSLRIN